MTKLPVQSPETADLAPVAPAVPRFRLHVPRAPEIVAQRIRKQIVSGVLKVNELLPPESKMMEEMGVSRPTIREALRILEAERLITVARGARGGAIIHAPDPDMISAYTLLVLQAERTTITEIFNTQRLLEPPLAREVANNGPANSVERLTEQLERERAAINDLQAFNTAVCGFHRTIVDLSGNRPLIHLMEAITSVIEKHQAIAMHSDWRTKPRDQVLASIEIAFRSQKKLIDLIGKRDGAGAEAHWFRHMDITHKLFVQGYETMTIHELLSE